MAMARGVAYPNRHLGKRLQEALQALIPKSVGLDSQSAVARWLGLNGRSKFNGWIKGRILPSTDEDVQRLTRLGLSEEEVRDLINLDRLDAFAIDAGMSPEKLVLLAANVARAGGVSIKALVELLEETDIEALAQALAPRAHRTDGL